MFYRICRKHIRNLASRVLSYYLVTDKTLNRCTTPTNLDFSSNSALIASIPLASRNHRRRSVTNWSRPWAIYIVDELGNEANRHWLTFTNSAPTRIYADKGSGASEPQISVLTTYRELCWSVFANSNKEQRTAIMRDGHFTSQAETSCEEYMGQVMTATWTDILAAAHINPAQLPDKY
jgi:hypothetical protein